MANIMYVVHYTMSSTKDYIFGPWLAERIVLAGTLTLAPPPARLPLLVRAAFVRVEDRWLRSSLLQ
jgi:hypothetical protein